jgi:ABC-type transport system involved in cytochrome bd biosynthesis fused ATPase/permease subunit
MKTFHDKTILCISHDENISEFFNKIFQLDQGVLN